MGSEVAASQLQRAGSVAGVHRLRCFVARGTLPGSGMEPVSPTLAGGFLNTGPPGRPVCSP